MVSLHHQPPVLSRRAISLSIICHAIGFFMMVALPNINIFQKEKPLKVVWVELPRGTSEDIMADIKKSEGLPRSTIEQQKKKPGIIPEEKEPNKMTVQTPNAKPEPKAKPETKPIPRQKPISPTERKIQQALAKLDTPGEGGAMPEAAQVKTEGQGFKYGTGTTPLRVMPSDPEYLKYQAMIRSKIINEWILPQRFLEEGAEHMNAKLEVMIDNEGEVVSVRWENPSGNQAFDISAIRAVKKASPFPKPPDRLAWEAYNEGFLIEFDPQLKP